MKVYLVATRLKGTRRWNLLMDRVFDTEAHASNYAALPSTIAWNSENEISARLRRRPARKPVFKVVRARVEL